MRLIPLALVPLLLAACSPAQESASAPVDAEPVPVAQAAPAAQADDPALGSAIAAVLGDHADTTRMAIKFAGEAEGRVALVYLVGMNWCGSGGCNLLILHQTASGWDQVGNVARVSSPVRILTTSSHGLPDIGVTVSGGGGPPPYEAKVSFDGIIYPRFPPDEPLVGAAGTVVIADADIPPPAAE